MVIHFTADVKRHHRHRVRIVSRSNSATLNRTRKTHARPRPRPMTRSHDVDSHHEPVNWATNTAVSGTMIRTPNCCAVRGSVNGDGEAMVPRSETSTRAGATPTVHQRGRAPDNVPYP